MITVQVKGSVTPFLAKAVAACENPEPILRAAGTTLLSVTEGNFQSYGAQYRPSPWAALMNDQRPPGTLKAGDPSTLKLRGTLSSSFRLAVDNAAATITNPMPYAAIHQLGGPIVRHPKNKSGDRLKIKTKKFGDVEVSWIVGAMPARPFFPIYPDGTLTDAADQLMTAAAQRELQKQLN